MEQKASINNATISESEVKELMSHYGHRINAFSSLNGGFSSQNLHCACHLDEFKDLDLVLKLANVDHSFEDIALQVKILEELERVRFPTNYVHPLLEERWDMAKQGVGGEYLDTTGPQIAILLDFVKGIPGDKLLSANADNDAVIDTMLQSLGATLAALHNAGLAEKLTESNIAVRDLHAGWPVSNTGDLLAVGKAEKDFSEAVVSREPFSAFVLERLNRFRAIYEGVSTETSPYPEGLIHGDGFLDNTLYDDTKHTLVALVDWEDACRAPFVLDLAVSIAGCAFSAENALVQNRIISLVQGYTSQRKLNSLELNALQDMVWAAVMACGAWRFLNFNLVKPDSPQEAKDSYKGMWKRLEALEAPGGWPAGAL